MFIRLFFIGWHLRENSDIRKSIRISDKLSRRTPTIGLTTSLQFLLLLFYRIPTVAGIPAAHGTVADIPTVAGSNSVAGVMLMFTSRKSCFLFSSTSVSPVVAIGLVVMLASNMESQLFVSSLRLLVFLLLMGSLATNGSGSTCFWASRIRIRIH
jgi:hypothetical protein